VTAIRDARPQDAPEVAVLLAELGYPAEPATVARRLDALTAADAVLLADVELPAHVTGSSTLITVFETNVELPRIPEGSSTLSPTLPSRR
jgi:hypothetical protein